MLAFGMGALCAFVVWLICGRAMWGRDLARERKRLGEARHSFAWETRPGCCNARRKKALAHARERIAMRRRHAARKTNRDWRDAMQRLELRRDLEKMAEELL